MKGDFWYLYFAGLGFFVVFILFYPNPTDRSYIEKSKNVKNECELLIPRNQVCEVVITAKVKEKIDG